MTLDRREITLPKAESPVAIVHFNSAKKCSNLMEAIRKVSGESPCFYFPNQNSKENY